MPNSDYIILLLTALCTVHLIVTITMVNQGIEHYFRSPWGRLGLIIRMIISTAFIEWVIIFYI